MDVSFHESKEIPGSMLQVPGPNSIPTGSRFDTSSENYAAGWPNTNIITESVRLARLNRVSREQAKLLIEAAIAERDEKL